MTVLHVVAVDIQTCIEVGGGCGGPCMAPQASYLLSGILAVYLPPILFNHHSIKH